MLKNPLEQERRFLLSNSQAQWLLMLASRQLSVEVFDYGRPIAYAHTIYFDALDRRYGCAVGGESHRVRVRQYASAETTASAPCFGEQAYLELKMSSREGRTKLRHRSTPKQLDALLNGGEVGWGEVARLRTLAPLHDLAMSIRQGELFPVLSTWYRRVSLFGDNLRMTIDENISSGRPIAIALAGQHGAPSHVDTMVSGQVLEIKSRGAIPGWLRHTLKSFGVSSMSKFERGIQSLAASDSSPNSAFDPLCQKGAFG